MNKPGLVGLFQPHFALEIDHYFSLILHWTRLLLCLLEVLKRKISLQNLIVLDLKRLELYLINYRKKR